MCFCRLELLKLRLLVASGVVSVLCAGDKNIFVPLSTKSAEFDEKNKYCNISTPMITFKTWYKYSR